MRRGEQSWAPATKAAAAADALIKKMWGRAAWSVGCTQDLYTARIKSYCISPFASPAVMMSLSCSPFTQADKPNAAGKRQGTGKEGGPAGH